METQFQITKLGYQRLNNLFQRMKKKSKDDQLNLVVWENGITRAKKIEPRKIKPEFVTVNSELELIDYDSNRTMKFRLV